MILSNSPSLLLLILSCPPGLTTSTSTTSTKQGLIYIPSDTSVQDTSTILSPPQSSSSSSEDTQKLSWYYNYSPLPSPNFPPSSSTSPGLNIKFIPMLWGLRPLEDKPDQFFATISSLISNGVEITHILSFNEPEMPQNVGGSDISPVSAATIFKSQILRLQSEKSLKIGAPSVSGSPEGLNWLREFFKECGDDCKPDFLPIHWYGNFLGLKQHVENVRELYPELDIWVTEFAYPNVGLNETQQFYNESVSFFEETDYIDRYSYFGSFRSNASNSGPNVAMLNPEGKLTDIGSWYLGGSATGNLPEGRAVAMRVSVGWLVFVLGASMWAVT